VLLEWGSHSAFTRLALITINFEKNYTGHSKSNFISAQIFKLRTQFTCNKSLPLLRHFALEADNFSSYFDYFQDEEEILILSTTLLYTGCIFHHNTHFTLYISPQHSLCDCTGIANPANVPYSQFQFLCPSRISY